MTDVAAFQTLGPRKRQEDAALHVSHGRGRLLVVADGMGGEPAGDVASLSAVLGFERGFGTPPDEPEDNLRWAIRLMDGLSGALDGMAEALDRGDGKEGMATTLAAVWVDPEGMRWVSVGDSGIWKGDVFGSQVATRMNRRHGKGNRVDSALVASARPFRAGSIAADFCVTEIDLHPGARWISSGALILVGSDGMDVLEDRWTPAGWSAPEEQQRASREWGRAFKNLNPGDFLSHVESALSGGVAQDNATAIALRTPMGRSRRAEGYVAVADAPDREVLSGVSA